MVGHNKPYGISDCWERAPELSKCFRQLSSLAQLSRVGEQRGVCVCVWEREMVLDSIRIWQEHLWGYNEVYQARMWPPTNYYIGHLWWLFIVFESAGLCVIFFVITKKKLHLPFLRIEVQHGDRVPSLLYKPKLPQEVQPLNYSSSNNNNIKLRYW